MLMGCGRGGFGHGEDDAVGEDSAGPELVGARRGVGTYEWHGVEIGVVVRAEGVGSGERIGAGADVGGWGRLGDRFALGGVVAADLFGHWLGDARGRRAERDLGAEGEGVAGMERHHPGNQRGARISEVGCGGDLGGDAVFVDGFHGATVGESPGGVVTGYANEDVEVFLACVLEDGVDVEQVIVAGGGRGGDDPEAQAKEIELGRRVDGFDAAEGGEGGGLDAELVFNVGDGGDFGRPAGVEGGEEAGGEFAVGFLDGALRGRGWRGGTTKRHWVPIFAEVHGGLAAGPSVMSWAVSPVMVSVAVSAGRYRWRGRWAS